jgi:Na+/pantothenate symporter
VVAGRDRPSTVVALGGVALGISPFLTWVNVVLLGGLNLFQLAEITGHRTGLAWSAVIVGGASAFGAWRAKSRRRTWLIGVVVGLLAGAVAILMLIGMVRDVRQAEGLARVSYGPWVAVLGCAAMVAGGLMSRRQPSAPG